MVAKTDANAEPARCAAGAVTSGHSIYLLLHTGRLNLFHDQRAKSPKVFHPQCFPIKTMVRTGLAPNGKVQAPTDLQLATTEDRG